MRKKVIPCRIIGAYDSETTNYVENGEHIAYPILHQIGLLDDTEVNVITPDNVEEHVAIELYRHTYELYERLDDIVNSYTGKYLPVLVCHNLSFDMYSLAPWLSRHDVRVLAKSPRKPISFSIKDGDGNTVLIIWDTLIFSQQSLSRMGADCGYPKAIGKWDYDKIRTPNTSLTDDETIYAKHDIYALIAWLGWWLRRNPEISPDKLGRNVVTKTGVVRERRRVRFENVKSISSAKNSVGRYWYYRCSTEAPKTDDELYTMFACTRGGFTFCASRYASVPFDLVDSNKVIAGYDATSMHPAQLVSSYVPYCFREVSAEVLLSDFMLIGKYTVDDVLSCWEKPFPVAFNACFRFSNLRPKNGTIYERDGILPLASARYKSADSIRTMEDEDNGDKCNYDAHLIERDYTDKATNAKVAFGKLVSADIAYLYITELSAFEIWTCYEWDSVEAVHGYETGRFTKPNDIDVISVMQFYAAKNAFKQAREEYYQCATIFNGETLKALGIPESIIDGMENAAILDNDIEQMYLSLKSDLNSIFGISCSNEYRRDTVLGASGIEYQGNFGLCNKPKNPKVWYQFGQRIVGKSRIAQLCAIELLSPYVDGIINGDTDSIKVLIDKSNLDKAQNALDKIGKAIDKGKKRTCNRITVKYPDLYDSLDYIGYYVHEFSADRFCASWNKAYCMHNIDMRTGKRRFTFTLAGLPTSRRENEHECFIGVDGYADRLYKLGWSFADICNLLLGYNVTYSNDLIRVNARKFPEWGSETYLKVTDYKDNTCTVCEPYALALYPMSKTINDTDTYENNVNAGYALANNPNVNMTHKILVADGIIDMSEVYSDDLLQLGKDDELSDGYER